MNKEVTFFGFTFTILTFALFAFAWTISLMFVWPYFLGVAAMVYFSYTLIALLFAGFLTRKTLLLIMVVFYFSKRTAVWSQNFMLFLSGFLSTSIYRFFVYMPFWKFLVQFLIISFSVYVYYVLIIKGIRVIEEEEP